MLGVQSGQGRQEGQTRTGAPPAMERIAFSECLSLLEALKRGVTSIGLLEIQEIQGQ